MRKIKEVLRLRFEVGLTCEAIGQSCNIGHTTVGEYLSRAKQAGLVWPLPEDMDNSSLEKFLYPRSPDPAISRPVPDWEFVHKSLLAFAHYYNNGVACICYISAICDPP